MRTPEQNARENIERLFAQSRLHHRQSERREHLSLSASDLPQKFAKEIGGLPTIMPAKAGIQKHLIFLDSGSR